MELKTVKVKSTETECGYMIINEKDFVEGEHEMYVEQSEEERLAAEKAEKEKAEAERLAAEKAESEKAAAEKAEKAKK